MIIRPSTFLKFYNILKKRKYGLLYSSGKKEKPVPKRPSVELIQAIVELKPRNPRFGCLRIAQQIHMAFERQISTKTSSGKSWLHITGLGPVRATAIMVDLHRRPS